MEENILGVDLSTTLQEKKVWCEKCGSLGVRHKNGCPELTANVVESFVEEKQGNNLYIENLEEVIKRVKEENAEKKLNPSMLIDGESGINFINGEPHLVIDNKYVPHDKAIIIIQTRKVVREWLKLQNLIKGIKEE